MKKYDGMTCTLERNGILSIYDEKGKEVYKDFVYKIIEFKQKLLTNIEMEE